MPSHHVHQAPYGAAGFSNQQVASQPPLGSIPGFAPSAAPLQTSTRLSRKRSRDEAAVNLDPPAKISDAEEGWVYGPGMVLIKAAKGYVPDASSQSGTWLEEKLEADERKLLEEQQGNIEPRSHKLQRVGRSLNVDTTLAVPMKNSAAAASEAAKSADVAPIIDDFTIHLGIGWRKISEDLDIQAAARGWARYIENHYPVTNTCIRLESKGLQSYLVEASDGFYLFADNLRQGRFVSATVCGALKNLQTSPPTFDGVESLVAADSPSPSSAETSMDSEMKMD